MTSTIEEAQSVDPPEQAAFRAEVRRFLAANSHPKQETSPWAVTFHTDPEGARRAFEAGRAWQRTRFEHGMTGFTYPKDVGGQGGEDLTCRRVNLAGATRRRRGSSARPS